MAHRSLASFSKLLLPLNGLDLDGLPTLSSESIAALPCSLASSLNHSLCHSLASILKSEFSRSVVPVTVATYCSRGAFFGGVRALGLGIVCGVVWSWTSCSTACGLLGDLCVLPVDPLAGVSILHALSGGLLGTAVSCCCARHDHCHRYVLGLLCMDQFRSTFHLYILSRAPSHGCCIRDYDRPRAGVVLYVWHRVPYVVCSMLASGPPALCRCGPLCFAYS